MKKLAVISALLLLLPETAQAAFNNGAVIPNPTAASQTLQSTSIAPFTWTPVTFQPTPYTTTGSAGDYTATFPGPVVVAPTGSAENGVSVTMPSGATGYGWGVKTSTGTVVSSASVSLGSGGIGANYVKMQHFNYVDGSHLMDFYGAVGSSGANTIGSYFDNAGKFFTSSVGLGVANGIQGYLSIYQGQFAGGDQIDVYNNASVKMFAVNSNSNLVTTTNLTASGVVTAPALLTAIKTVTANYTLTPTDTTILVNGAYTVSLPTPSASLAGHAWTVKEIGAAQGTVAGTVDGNTAGYTLAGQYNFAVIATDGTAYYITGKG